MIEIKIRTSGFALASALIILATLTLLVITAASRNTMNELMAGNQRDSVNAMVIAESGIELGFATIRRDYIKEREFLTAELEPYLSTPMFNDTISGGTYSVTFPQVNANYVVMNSVGSVAGAEREIEVVFQIDGNATSRYVILTEEDIDALAGTPNIIGPFANVHSNSDVNLQGNPQIAGDLTASGVISATGRPSIGGNQTSGAGAVEIPHVYPPDYLPFATVVMSPDCRVLTPEGVLIANLSGGVSKWHGWSCLVNQKWMMSGNVQPELMHAFYYIQGNVELSGSPNGIWFASFVAEGYIQISGNADYRPWGSAAGNNTGDHTANEILFLAGNDLVIAGTPAQSFTGIMAAHMEVSVSGNVFIEGSLVAENGKYAMGQEIQNGQAVVDLVVDVNKFDGNMTMVASGTAKIGGGNPMEFSAWRELVH